jgi:hypothetical protein
MGTIAAMERNTIRRCEAVKWENDPEYGAIAVPCGESATAWVITPYTAAKRIADLSGSNVARFIQRRAACDRHAAMAAERFAAAR